MKWLEAVKDRVWQWFEQHAHKPHALAWLSLVAFTDAIFFPIAPEIFLVALTTAQPTHWRRYLSVSILSSALGAVVAYFIAVFIFNQFGEPILAWYGFERAFVMAQHSIGQHVFFAMALASFTPIPDKVFIYAAGFLHAPFTTFFVGYVLGRSARMALFVYMAGRYGKHVLDFINKYFFWFTVILFALLAVYGIVHWHIFPW
ncbi:VTT domain-containing protein [Candidatus Parcubacteria bacterium]|nr:VTT domain-containing protein [Candidatus Parcubacteria bacterium]